MAFVRAQVVGVATQHVAL
jgi:hypothetical protein